MEFNEIINSSKPTLVDFYADWCSPCKIMSPIIEQTKNSLGDDATVLKINIDNNMEVAKKYQIRRIPTLLIFKEGEIVWRQSGVISKEIIIDALKKYSNIKKKDF
jgi:thioredoxin 1